MPPQFISLMYHNVIRDDAAGARDDTDGLGPSITAYFVGEAQFSEHLDAIAGTADVLTYADVQRFYFGVQVVTPDSPRPLVQLTFDDGWRGTLDVAGPMLADRGVQALVFVTTGLIGAKHFLSRGALARLPAANFHVGSHSVSHGFLNEMPDHDIRRELLESRQVLEDIVGYGVDAVSIPNGAADARVVRIAEECGYRCVFVSNVHANTRRRGPQRIGRVAIRNTTAIESIERYARGDLGREGLRSGLLRWPKRLLGAQRYRRVRSSLLGQSADDRDMCDLVQENVHRRSAVIGAPPTDRPVSPSSGSVVGASR